MAADIKTLINRDKARWRYLQNQRQHRGLPFGTRGGMLVRHSFPSDGDYKFSVQNFGLGKYVPGEQLEFLIDGERVHLTNYVGVGLTQGMSGDNDGAIEVTIPAERPARMWWGPRSWPRITGPAWM